MTCPMCGYVRQNFWHKHFAREERIVSALMAVAGWRT